MRNPALLVVLAAVFLTQGCGYHLRGQTPAAGAPSGYSVHVSTAPGPLADAVKSQLALSGLEITGGITKADYVLAISGEEFTRQVASVSPETGKVEEYRVVLTARISITRAGGEDLVTGQAVEANGDYAFDEDAALGKFAEEETIRRELVGQVATQIVNRLNILAGADQ